MKYKVNTILHTKDGRKIGNAIITGHETKKDFPYQLNLIKTDYGSTCKLTDKEIEELFHIGYEDFSAEETELMELSRGKHKHAV